MNSSSLCLHVQWRRAAAEWIASWLMSCLDPGSTSCKLLSQRSFSCPLTLNTRTHAHTHTLFNGVLWPPGDSTAVKVACYILVGVGAFSMLLGILGCVGAVYEVRCLLGLVSSQLRGVGEAPAEVTGSLLLLVLQLPPAHPRGPDQRRCPGLLPEGSGE